jgi:hypothetical protein
MSQVKCPLGILPSFVNVSVEFLHEGIVPVLAISLNNNAGVQAGKPITLTKQGQPTFLPSLTLRVIHTSGSQPQPHEGDAFNYCALFRVNVHEIRGATVRLIVLSAIGFIIKAEEQ